MLHVRLLSGATVAEVDVEELKTRLQTEETPLVALKRFLGAQLGCSRFRLKLFGEDSEIHDDAPLTGPADLLLVKMDFQPADATFIPACSKGHLTEVERLLQTPQNPDARQDGATALYIACERGHSDVARLLLEAGSDKDAARQDGATALYI